MSTSLIIEIKGNSLDDGPGIRTVVFFKGCLLDCVGATTLRASKEVAGSLLMRYRVRTAISS